jgi:hypothetical protein
MIEFLSTTYFFCGARVLKQKVGIAMCTNCVPLLIEIYHYEADCIHGLIKKKRQEACQVL